MDKFIKAFTVYPAKGLNGSKNSNFYEFLTMGNYALHNRKFDIDGRCLTEQIENILRLESWKGFCVRTKDGSRSFIVCYL